MILVQNINLIKMELSQHALGQNKKLNIWDKLKQGPASNFKPQATTSDSTIIRSQPVVILGETRTEWSFQTPSSTPSKNNSQKELIHIQDNIGDYLLCGTV